MSSGRVIYLNGDFVPETEAQISLFDSQNVWGDMVFETTRTFNHEPFKLRQHLDRLYASMKVTQIDCGMTLDELETATHDLIQRNLPVYDAAMDFALIHNVSRGPHKMYASLLPQAPRPTVIIHTWPMEPYIGSYAQWFDCGVHAVTPRQRAIPARLLDPKIKNRSRIYYQLAQLEMQQIGRDAWAVLVDEDGYLTEGTGSNFFLVRDGELRTPEPRNVLRGVTRQTIFELAGELAIPVREMNLEPYDALTADEAFFTSTPFFLMPATRFNDRPVGDGQVGPIARRLIDVFSESVGVDIVAQARGYAAPSEPA